MSRSIGFLSAVAVVLGFAVALPLAACSDSDWASVMPASDSPPTAPRSSLAVNATEPFECIQAATWRSTSAADQGFDESTQKVVYDQTLTDCEKWRSKTGH